MTCIKQNTELSPEIREDDLSHFEINWANFKFPKKKKKLGNEAMSWANFKMMFTKKKKNSKL